MAKIVRREIRSRGFFGWVFLLLFYGFNALMLIWLLSYWGKVGGSLEAGRAGAAIGTMMILKVWAAGAVVTGLLAILSRGRRTIIEETDD